MLIAALSLSLFCGCNNNKKNDKDSPKKIENLTTKTSTQTHFLDTSTNKNSQNKREDVINNENFLPSGTRTTLTFYSLGGLTPLIPEQDECKRVLENLLYKASDTIYLHSSTGHLPFSMSADSFLSKFKPTINSLIDRLDKKESDNHIYQNRKLQSIYNQIQILKRHTHDLSSEFAILDSMNKLVDCKLKIDLFLEYGELQISKNDYLNDINAVCNGAAGVAKNISSPIERSQAYEAIGNYAAENRVYEKAIPMYYLAKSSIENSSTDTISRFKYYGNFFQQLANIFSNCQVKEAHDNATNYSDSAILYFLKSKDNDAANFFPLTFWKRFV